MTKVSPSSVPHEQSFPLLVSAWNDHPPAASETGGASDGSSSKVGVVNPRWMSWERSELSPCAIPSRPLPFSPVEQPVSSRRAHRHVDIAHPRRKRSASSIACTGSSSHCDVHWRLKEI